jgi:hypothetical protein
MRLCNHLQCKLLYDPDEVRLNAIEPYRDWNAASDLRKNRARQVSRQAVTTAFLTTIVAAEGDMGIVVGCRIIRVIGRHWTIVATHSRAIQPHHP